ncbi:ankyrin repeat-containing protein NPR4-like [Syzygium oleosum]|uniref:ankyrin repeat-containing protein NPR4-like n=1 Tax=Syzygium oleosum TaxID=219896 RepID=UPI0024BB5BBB|nr:ankyrin repeat-containing protein NPR4-like [Syzygium oleosum]
MNAHMNTEMNTEILELLSRIVLDAASRGISEIVKLCFEHFPELMWTENFIEKLMEEVVNGRHVELFRLVSAHCEIPLLTDDKTRKDIPTRKDILMKAVVDWSPRCRPKDVSGAPFLMQRELQWFKVLEDTSHTSSKSMKLKVSSPYYTIDPASKSRRSPKDNKTYWDDFVEKRKQLLIEAGQWMKDTSSSCSLVSTLIITVAFAAAFTAPGGNDGSTGMPIFLKRGSFMVFAVADAFALFSSVTATLMFLAILTSRYAAEDFLYSLPEKMILGLTFLFLSLAFMLVAFSSALTIILSERLTWIYIPITLLAAIPFVLFAILQLPLYFEMVESTYWPRLYRPLKLWK